MVSYTSWYVLWLTCPLLAAVQLPTTHPPPFPAAAASRTRYESFKEQAGAVMQGITAKSNDAVAAEGFGVTEMTEMDEWMSKFEGECSEDFEAQVRAEV